MRKMFDWYGGKARVAHIILACTPPDVNVWHEACMGSAVVTLNSERHRVEAISDLDDDLVHLFGTLAHPEKGQALLERLMKLQYSRDEFNSAREAKKSGYAGLDEFRKAELIYVHITQSFNNARKCFRKHGVSQRDYTFMLQSNLPEVWKRLQGVRVMKMNCVDVVNELRNNPKAFVMLDVPYLWELRAKGSRNIYGHEMSKLDHIELLEACKDAKCKIMICGYRKTDGNDLYDNMLDIPHSHWKHYTLAQLVKSCQTKTEKDTATETIWVNYELPYIAKFYINTKSEEENPAIQQWTSMAPGVIIPSTKEKEVA